MCKDDLGDPNGELFGPVVKKKISKRATTIKNFNESVKSLDTPAKKPQNRFLGKGSGAKYGDPSHNQRPYNNSASSQRSYSQQRFHKTSTSSLNLSNLGHHLTRGSSLIAVGARLKYFVVAWHKTTDNPWIIEIIQGYRLEFVANPPPLEVNPSVGPQRYPLGEEKLITEEVFSLLRKGAIEEVHNIPGFYSRIFLVAKKDGGWRLVVNLNIYRSLTSKWRAYTVKRSFKRGRLYDQGSKINLQDAYLAVPICSERQEVPQVYLGGKEISVSVPPIRVGDRTPRFHKTSQTCSELPLLARPTSNHVHRRYFVNGSHSGGMSTAHSDTNQHISESRFPHESEKNAV